MPVACLTWEQHGSAGKERLPLRQLPNLITKVLTLSAVDRLDGCSGPRAACIKETGVITSAATALRSVQGRQQDYLLGYLGTMLVGTVSWETLASAAAAAMGAGFDRACVDRYRQRPEFVLPWITP